MSIHLIRLRGPWQYEPLARSVQLPDGRVAETAEGLPQPGRAIMPADWSGTLGADFYGRVRYCRSFARPTGLEPQETVWLVSDGVVGSAEIVLNDRPLGRVRSTDPTASFDVTPWLLDRNRLVVDLDWPLANGQQAPGVVGSVGEFRLAIESGKGGA